MYCSFRFYTDDPKHEEINNPLLQLIELSNSLFSINYDFIYYFQFDPESDKLLKNKKFAFDTKGKQLFLSEEILPPMNGTAGDISEPIIGATCSIDSYKLYSKIRCEITISQPPSRTVIRIDFCDCFLKHSIVFSDFEKLLTALKELGFFVNTSYYHVYSSQKGVTLLDGGQIGSFFKPASQRMLDLFQNHSCHGSCLPDVFCANAIPIEALDYERIQRIRAIVGKENTSVLNDRLFCFSLPDLDEITSMYRITNRKMIRQLRSCLQEQQFSSKG